MPEAERRFERGLNPGPIAIVDASGDATFA
jgi:hypothetical protein